MGLCLSTTLTVVVEAPLEKNNTGFDPHPLEAESRLTRAEHGAPVNLSEAVFVRVGPRPLERYVVRFVPWPLSSTAVCRTSYEVRRV